MPGKYHVFDYVKGDLIGDVMNMSDLIITRAGANTLCELLALGKKAIMIPIAKTSHDEQATNAKFYASTGLGVMLEENKLTGNNLLEQIKLLINNVPPQSVVDAGRSHIVFDAADRLAEAVIKYSK